MSVNVALKRPAALEIEVRGLMRADEPMKKHTSWRAGGVAAHYFEPADVDDLADFLRQCPSDEALLFLGLGSNLLVRDGGFRGVVVALSKVKELSIGADGVIVAGAGIACAKIARASAQAGFTGGEFLAGIPGTIGGALAMNAGAYGGEIWRRVTRVGVIDRRGRRQYRAPAEFEIAYRRVDLPHSQLGRDEWFVSAELQLDADADGKAGLRIRDLLRRRARSQPLGQASCGSVFRNPEGDHAARLIEASGLKGRSVGAAYVSEKHANFIINAGAASAADIEALMLLAQRQVRDDHGVDLIPEVRIVGVAA